MPYSTGSRSRSVPRRTPFPPGELQGRSVGVRRGWRSCEHGPVIADDRQPSPQVAYTRWVAACADAGWQGRPAIGQVPVPAALGRVTALALHARRASPRFACAAMDGIALAWDG